MEVRSGGCIDDQELCQALFSGRERPWLALWTPPYDDVALPPHLEFLFVFALYWATGTCQVCVLGLAQQAMKNQTAVWRALW